MDNIMNKYTGSDFDDFLSAEGFLEEATGKAHKRLLTLQLNDAMKASKISKVQLAEKMQTSRSQIDRLLDPDNTAVTLESLERLASAVGRQLRIEMA